MQSYIEITRIYNNEETGEIAIYFISKTKFNGINLWLVWKSCDLEINWFGT